MENIEVSQNIESRETKGRNVVIDAIFERHGEKEFSTETGETGLTKKGVEMSADYGRNLKEKDAIKPYSSKTDRTVDTVMEAVDASPTKHKLKLRIRKDLQCQVDFKAPFFNGLLALKGKMLGEDFHSLPIEKQDILLREYGTLQHDKYLSHGATRPDKNTQSPLELAAGIANRVETYIKMADMLNSGSNVDLLNGTHDLNIASFLKEVMVRKVDNKEIRGFDSVKEIGGPIGYNESFTVRICTDEHGQKAVILLFRGQEFEIDMPRLAELSALAKSEEREANEIIK